MSFLNTIKQYNPPWSETAKMAFVILFLIFLFFVSTKFRSKRWSRAQAISACALFAYLYIVFMSVVFLRPVYPHYRIELIPFWSYKQFRNPFIRRQIFLNIALFFPYGFLASFLFRGRPKYKRIILSAFFLSATIECLQLIFRRGLFEWDDMFHNTLGAALGGMIHFIFFCKGNRKNK